MKAFRLLALAALLAIGGVSRAQSAHKTGPASARERLIGAWHLVSLSDQAADGKQNTVSGLKGTLIYTHDGHMSVQIMYPASQSALSNDYVKNGYEASFGSYDVDERAHTVTHHVTGSITPGLVGKDLTRRYQLSEGRLIIRSTRPDEHWFVTWQHD